MKIAIFNNVNNKDKSNALESLIKLSSPRQDFFLLVILSVFMATIGLHQNNVAIIIGSMLIAPVLYPILGIAMGTVMADSQLIIRSIRTFSKSLLIGIVIAALVTLFFNGSEITAQAITPEILLRIKPSLADAITAIIAGLAASFALVKPKLSETLPGVAISVSLVPPLAVVGIGIASLSWSITSGALILLLINILGILFACVMVFSIMNFYVNRQVADNVIKKEDKKIEKENNGDDNEKNKDSNEKS